MGCRKRRRADPAIVGAGTAVIPLQNGVDAAERLIPILGREAVMGDRLCHRHHRLSRGVRQTGTYQQMTFGELDGRLSERGQRLRSVRRGRLRGHS